jgi:hypothetical protein
MPFQPPVTFVTRQIIQPRLKVMYPEVTGLHNPTVLNKINVQILSLMKASINLQLQAQLTKKTEIRGYFEIKTNERGFLSIMLISEARFMSQTQKQILLKALNFDIKTGHNLQLTDLFMPGLNHVFKLSKIVQKQMRQRQIPLSHSYVSVEPQQDYYLADKSLVIFFPQFETTPSIYGIPMFPISIFEILDVANPDGPLRKLTTISG